MDITQVLKEKIADILVQLRVEKKLRVEIEIPKDMSHGDFSTNVALVAGKGRVFAEEVVQILQKDTELAQTFENITVEGPGFINFLLSKDYLLSSIIRIIEEKGLQIVSLLADKRIIVEYAHPNTHKEMHIGHMRTLITGEALARLCGATGASVFRANYQGDIGPHVAKAMFGVEKLLKERSLRLEEAGKWTHTQKAHFLGEAYVLGNQEYSEHKDQIDGINAKLYNQRDSGQARLGEAGQNDEKNIVHLYKITRQWSLDYYEEFYKRFYTKFDRLFFESDMVVCGKDIVEKGDIFEKDQGALVFKGERYGLHTRVFVTSAGHPTYEGKEMALALAQYEAFPFDKNIHVVASEQAGYFRVIFKALELLDPEKFKDTQYHLSMGMVHLIGHKMSSRTGEILTVDSLIDLVKEKVEALMSEGRIQTDQREKVIEQITIGAIKYSVLKVGTAQDAAFDIEKSVSLEGDSGPYLQYTFARTQSVLAKAKNVIPNLIRDPGQQSKEMLNQVQYDRIENEELSLLRLLIRFPVVVSEAAEGYAPNTLCAYLFELARLFNLFYQKYPILKEKEEVKTFRLSLTSAVGSTLRQGLHLLGIESPEKM